MLIQAITAILDDDLPFLGDESSSHLFKISPFVCLYDIIWKLIDQLLRLQVHVSVITQPDRFEHDQSNEPLQHDELPEHPLPRPLELRRLLRLALEFASIVQAAELFMYNGLPWIQTFVLCYASHWILVLVLRKFGVSAVEQLNHTEVAKRHRITRVIFSIVCHSILCFLSLSPQNGLKMFGILIAGASILALCGVGARSPDSTPYVLIIGLYTYWHIYLILFLYL